MLHFGLCDNRDLFPSFSVQVSKKRNLYLTLIKIQYCVEPLWQEGLNPRFPGTLSWENYIVLKRNTEEKSWEFRSTSRVANQSGLIYVCSVSVCLKGGLKRDKETLRNFQNQQYTPDYWSVQIMDPRRSTLSGREVTRHATPSLLCKCHLPYSKARPVNTYKCLLFKSKHLLPIYTRPFDQLHKG